MHCSLRNIYDETIRLIMCWTCWEEEEFPKIDNLAVRSIQAAIQSVYNEHCTGGNLHIAIDDWNLEDHYLEWIENEWAIEHPLTIAERNCLEKLKVMNIKERFSALALYDGMWG